MSTHEATIQWKRGDTPFKYEVYPRDHEWRFGSGSQITASAAAQYRGNPALPNPEETLVGALSSCHMLTFLAMAARRGFVVDEYRDPAVGHLEKDAQGALAITRVELRPQVKFSGPKTPTGEDIAKLHEEAHKNCFVANSVKTDIKVLPG